MPAANTVRKTRRQNSQVKVKRLIIEADRVESTDDERAWLDVVDKVMALVYEDSGNGWHDAINLQVRMEERSHRGIPVRYPVQRGEEDF